MAENEPPIPESVPEDPIKEITEDLKMRESQRSHAVELAFIQLDEAETREEKIKALDNLARMMGVHDEFRHKLFPEFFPIEDE